MNSKVVFFQAIISFSINVSCKNETKVENSDITNKSTKTVEPHESEKIPNKIPEGMVLDLRRHIYTRNRGAR